MTEYSIKQISDMFQLPASTLRYYEEMGILTDVERTASGQRIYRQKHINRLRTICCFKKTGMTISQLRTFFTYEKEEECCIDDILNLLTEHKAFVVEQISQLQSAYVHILRKLDYYGDIKKSMDAGQPLPDWKDYKDKSPASLPDELKWE